MNQLFKDLRVLDLSSVLAGPSVATFFAELGASVIKIENPKTHGDVTRSWKLPQEKTAVSAYWSSVNYAKQIEFLDIGENISYIKELLATSDILITNFKFGDAEKFGLTPQILREEFPKLIQASITGFKSNPRRVAYDVVLQAETGFMFMNGMQETPPLKMPVAMMDVLAAHQLKEAILCALYQREKTGEGTVVTASLEKSGISSLVNQASNYLMSGMIPQREGSLHPNIAPYGETFCTKDNKWLVLAIGSDGQFEKLCTFLDIPEVKSLPQFQTNSSRVLHRSSLSHYLEKAFVMKDSQEILENAIRENVPIGMVRSMDSVFESSVAQSMVLKEVVNGEITFRVSGIAFEEIKKES